MRLHMQLGYPLIVPVPESPCCYFDSWPQNRVQRKTEIGYSGRPRVIESLWRGLLSLRDPIGERASGRLRAVSCSSGAARFSAGRSAAPPHFPHSRF